MATQVYSSHQQTRQQLDELDGLLQRMLSLPVQQVDTGKPSPEPMRPEAFAPMPPTLPQVTSSPRPANGKPVVQAWRMAMPAPAEQPPLALPVDEPMQLQAPAPVPYPYSMVFGQPLPAESFPPPAPQTNAAPAPSAPAYAEPAPAAAPVAPAWAVPLTVQDTSGHSFLQLPFVAINGLFDILTYLLGPLGGWLRRPMGRNALGWLGILMILAAGSWAAVDWFGVDWKR